MATLQSLLVRLGIDADDFSGGLARAGKSLNRFRDDLVENTRGVEDFGSALSSLGRTTSLASLASSATSLSAAIAPAAGSLLLLPGAAAAGGAAMGTLNVAMNGFGEALSNVGDPEKFAESLEGLSTNAAAAAREVAALAPRWEQLATSVQDAAFAGVSDQIAALGGTYLPILDTGMTALAGTFNDAALEAAQFASSAQTIADVEAIFADTRFALENLVGAVSPLLSALRDIAAVGTSVLPSLTSGAEQAAERFAEFIATARRTGELEQWMRGGLDVLRQLWEIASNLGSALAGIFRAAQGPGQDLLATLTQLTAQFATWANSAEGQQTLTALFDTLGQVAGHLLVILPMLAGAVTTLAGWIATLPGPVQTLITGFLAWSLVIGGLITKFAPLFSLLGTLGGRFLTAATTSGTALNRIILAMGRFAAATVRFVLRATVMSVQVIARFVVMAVRVVLQVTLMGARVGAQFALMAARGIAKTAVMAARVVARWAIMAAGAMARAVIMAAAWFVAMGPVGWVIAIVIALVALIIANWDKVKNWTIKAWNAVVDFVVGAWQGLVSAVSTGISAVGSFIRGLPGKIVSWLGNLGSLLVNAGKQIIQGLIDGLMSAVGWLQDKLSWITGLIPDWKGPIRVDARLLQPTGQVIMQGLVEGLDTGADDVHRKLGSITAQIAKTPAPRARPARETDQSTQLVTALRAAVAEGMPNELVIDQQGGRLIARTVNRVNTSNRRR